MRSFRSLSLALLLASAAPLAAQYVQPLPQTFARGDADSLADQVRALAANPNDLTALVRAGELALKLEDPTAAGGFFARAERLDPRNPRVKAGTAVLLVQAERPGEALRRFAEAESYGGRVASFAADRGLAFDLVGEQERAQRDYRLALKTAPDDETTRRYALSLGISGKREEALALLDPLLRKSDRGAWRARAFVLAMSGDKADAEQIAATMMPAGMAQGLQPFFDRLPTLSPVDRAFAVHFGEIRPSAQRYADARMVPVLPPLGPDPDARELAAAAKAREKPARKEEVAKPAKRKRNKHEPVELAVQAAAPPAALPLPAPPRYVDPATPRPNATPAQGTYYVQPLPTPRAYTPTYSYNPVAQANRAAAAATVPVTPAPAPVRAPPAVPPTQVTPYSQPVQRAGGRVMPLAPLQPQPLPAGMAQPRAFTPTTPPVEAATRVERPLPTYGAPSAPPRATMTMAAPPPETATKVTPFTPVAAPPRAQTATVVPPAEPVTKVDRAPQTVAAYPAPLPTSPIGTASRAAVSPQPYAPLPSPVAVETAARAPQAAPTYPSAQTTPQPSIAASAPVSPPGSYSSAAPVAATKSRSEDAILSGIIAQIGVPGRELGVAPVAPESRPTPIAPPPVEAARPAPVELAAIKAPVRAEPQHHNAPADDGEAALAGRKPATGKAVDPDGPTGAKIRKTGGKKTVDADLPADHKTSADMKKSASKKGTEPDDDAGARKGATGGKAIGKKADRTDDEADTRKGGAAKKTTGKKTAEGDDEADADTRKGGDSKKTDKKGDAKKKADAKKNDPKLLEPARVWVQVSGGANENDLPKQWNKLRTDKPAAFKGRQGWSTPLRATNRILTGPFASEAEAQAYVNKLSKQGLSGFLFNSEPGQKIDKLPAK